MTTCRLLAAVLPVALGPAPAAAQEISGAWHMTVTPGSVNTCPGNAESAAYEWFVSEAGGDVTVVVQGETAYPKLAGKRDGGTLVLEGEGLGRHMTTGYPNAVFVLDVIAVMLSAMALPSIRVG